jgi:hypothetical protein
VPAGAEFCHAHDPARAEARRDTVRHSWATRRGEGVVPPRDPVLEAVTLHCRAIAYFGAAGLADYAARAEALLLEAAPAAEDRARVDQAVAEGDALRVVAEGARWRLNAWGATRAFAIEGELFLVHQLLWPELERVAHPAWRIETATLRELLAVHFRDPDAWRMHPREFPRWLNPAAPPLREFGEIPPAAGRPVNQHAQDRAILADRYPRIRHAR